MNGNKTAIISVVAIIVVALIAYFAIRKAPSAPNLEPTPIGTEPAAGTRQPGSPNVTTKGVSFISQSTAVLNGEVNPNGVQTSYWYEYGTTESLGRASGAQLIGGGYVTYSAPAAVTGLSANTAYFYRLVAQNQYGKVNGGLMSFQTTNTPPPPYVAPTVETRAATEVAENQATLQALVNPRGSTTTYWFEFGRTTALGDTTGPKSAGAGTANVSVSTTITGLEQDTTYYYRVDAQNGYGTVVGAIRSFTTRATNPPPRQGDAPDVNTMSATNVGQTSSTVRGEVDPNGSQTSFYFEYGKSSLFGLFTLDQKTTSQSAGGGNAMLAVSAGLSGLDPSSTYYYRLVASSSFGTSRGAIFSFTTSGQ